MKPPTQSPRRNLPNELRKVSVARITDPTTAQGSIEVLNQDVIDLAPGEFEVKRVTVPFDECCLIYMRSNAALRTRTLVHQDFDACAVLGPQASGSVDGRELHPYALMAAGPGAQAEIVIDRDYESVSLLIPPQVLNEHLALRRTRTGFVSAENHELWHPTAGAGRKHFELGVQIAEAAENSPDIFNDNHWARHGAQVEFMDSLLVTIESCQLSEHADTGRKARSYSQIVKTCEDYTLNLDGRRPYVSELCEAASVSERTLQYAFHDILGMSPLTYLHRLRLHRARSELREVRRGSTTVTDVAMNWGFWQFGEFSRAYKNCFGELPSQTLKQTSNN